MPSKDAGEANPSSSSSVRSQTSDRLAGPAEDSKPKHCVVFHTWDRFTCWGPGHSSIYHDEVSDQSQYISTESPQSLESDASQTAACRSFMQTINGQLAAHKRALHSKQKKKKKKCSVSSSSLKDVRGQKAMKQTQRPLPPRPR